MLSLKRSSALIFWMGLGAALDAASAGGFTIMDGQVANTTQLLDAPGDVGMVEGGGTIDASDYGINATAPDVRIGNAGTVTGSAAADFQSAAGIAAQEQNFAITNSGRVAAHVQGSQSSAVAISGLDSGRIVNVGHVFATADERRSSSTGIAVEDNNRIENAGDILAEVGGIISDATGIFGRDNNVIDNTGRIVATSNGYVGSAAGIEGLLHSVIRNSGAVMVEANGTFAGAVGIDFGDSGQLTNTQSGLVDVRAAGEAVNAFGFFGSFYSTVTNQGILRVTVTGSGSSQATGIRAIDENAIVNDGLIDILARGAGNSAYGVSVQDLPVPGDPGNVIRNAGRIRAVAEGDDSGAVGMFGYLGNTVSNSGHVDVETFGSDSHAYGVSMFSFATITNAAEIRSHAIGYGADSTAISAVYISDISNAGSAVSEANGIGAVSTGVLLPMGESSVDNSGTILSSAAGADARAYGIKSQNGVEGDSITNTGAVRATASGLGAESYGILADHDNLITNCGTLAGGTAAIRLTGAGNTLNLCKGSFIEGAMQLGNGNALNVDLGRGINAALSYDGSPTVTVSGGPHVVSGNTVAVVDPTGFASEDEMLTDLTRVIADGVDARLAAARLNRPAGAVALDNALVTPTADAPQAASGDVVFWASAIGQTRSQDADGQYAGFDTQLGGLMIGADGALTPSIRAGAFLGASASNLETDSNSQVIDADNYFGGLYAGFQKAAPFLNLAVTAGVSDQNSNRLINNNLASGGTEHAKANDDGVFISPAATLGADIAVPGAVFTPSVRARYAALFLDGYDEHGSAADLSVDARTVQVFDLRGQFAFAVPVELEGGALSFTTRLGIDATFASASDVSTQLLGETLDMSIDGQDTAEGFAGLDASYTTTGGTRFFATTEFGLQQDLSTTAQATAGFELPL